MKLTDLEPRWIYKRNVFAFRCPHCREIWLTCKNVAMGMQQQFDIAKAAFSGDAKGRTTWVPMKEDCAWTIEGHDFEAISVQPSIDASKAGHWHGHITSGEIVGGI